MIPNFLRQIRQIQGLLSELANEAFAQRLEQAVQICHQALANQRPLLVCGNGGSAADAQHIAGELVGQFLRARRALNVRALTTDSSILTAWANDVDYETVFSRQVEAYGCTGGVLLAITTSGNSRNVIAAARVARESGMKVIGLTGQRGGTLAPLCDVLLDVPSTTTPRVQEMHMMVYHYLCEAVECLVDAGPA
jgi:D-sedoheptulose 7-phosphate isomerase